VAFERRLVIQGRSRFTSHYLIWCYPLFLAAICSVFVFQIPAYPTLIYARIPFEQVAKVDFYMCESVSRTQPRHTDIEFIDELTKNRARVTFAGNLCKEIPGFMKSIYGKEVVFHGREWFWG